MAGEYGFSYYKRQFIWVPSSSDQSSFTRGPLELATFNAQPRSLQELRSHWASEAALSQNYLRFICTWLKDGSNEKTLEWNLDCEQDFLKALQLVNSGETVMLTVITQKDTLADREKAFNKSFGALPPWFADYMKKFRSELVTEIGQMIDEKLAIPRGRHHHHHHPKHGDHPPHKDSHREVQKGAHGMADFKCMKIEKKLQKLQNWSQKMSLELEEAEASSPFKHKGERMLGKMTRKMEKLESRRNQIMAKKTLRMPMESREQLDASAPDFEEPKYENVVESNPPERIGSGLYFDACVLVEGETSILKEMEDGNLYSAFWVVQNLGITTWGEGIEIRLHHASAGVKVNEHSIAVPAVKPGDKTSIQTTFQVPRHPGLFELYFHFYAGEKRFGQALRCSFTVDPIPGETRLETTTVCSNTLTHHPFIKEIREADLTGSIAKTKEQEDRGEYESDHDDDEDDTSSDSDDSDSFVHIPMPACYQFKMDEGANETVNEGESTSAIATSMTSNKPDEPQTAANEPCKTPPTTPKNAESDADGEPTSDVTLIKYPELDLNAFRNAPIFPDMTKSVGDREKSPSPVQILPENLVAGAMNVAAKAFSSAEAIMRSLQGSTSSIPSVASDVPSTVEPPKPTVPEQAAFATDESLTDPRTQNLITLAEMGFLNDRLNERLLDTYKENLQEVVAYLLSRQGGSTR